MKIKYLLPRIPLPLRITFFVLCEGGGIFIQIFFPSLWLFSFIIMIAGAFFIIARNYKNKPMDLGFEDWQPVSGTEYERIEQNLKMTKKLSYPFVYKSKFGVTVIVLLGFAIFFAFVSESPGILLLAVDVAIIFFPVSWTGIVNLWTPSQLQMKMGRFGTIMDEAKKARDGLLVTPYLRLDKDKEGRQIPEDVRLMIEPKRKPEDFLGVQFQVAINNGPNGAVPYMYAVFLCKGKGHTYTTLKKLTYGSMIKEPGGDEEYGFIVVRQRTGGGGYHTSPRDCARLFGIVKEKLKEIS
jgi:hypothetical protein